MKRLIWVVLSVLVFAAAVSAQNSNTAATTNKNTNKSTTTTKRKPPFRANADQVKQAQAILKQRNFYSGEETGKLDDATRAGLKKYQEAEGLKVTGTLNKVTLEKMAITLTDKQKTM
jgi:peptidoglycan hydrolase-like protein with peptidoglycan-binding domain